MVKPRLIDTNILYGANLDGLSQQLSLACKIACNYALMQALAGEYLIVLDETAETGSEILAEYRRNLPYNGGSAGSLFLRWLLNKISDETVCRLVPITPTPDQSYEEFPTRADLAAFDPNDRKWIAAAVAHFNYFDTPAPILQAADHKWRAFAAIFSEEYVQIEFLCDEPVK